VALATTSRVDLKSHVRAHGREPMIKMLQLVALLNQEETVVERNSKEN
jgi:hypothetical protein